MPSTTSYNRGEIAFSDQSAVKVLPAVVAHGPYHPPSRPGEFAIRFWREGGCPIRLSQSALLRRSNSVVRKILGHLHVDDLKQLDSALPSWFGL